MTARDDPHETIAEVGRWVQLGNAMMFLPRSACDELDAQAAEVARLRPLAAIGQQSCPLYDASYDVAWISAVIDDSYDDDVSPEAVDWRRLQKCAEEVGEVLRAYGGAIGENPRKGVTHTMDDVCEELLDVAACALGAHEHMRRDSASFEALVAHVASRRERLALAAGVSTEPAGEQ